MEQRLTIVPQVRHLLRMTLLRLQRLQLQDSS
jgi:hypothetical protein